MTLRLDAVTLQRLDHLAEVTERSKAWLAAQAVTAYLEHNEWQIGAIDSAVKRANSGNAAFINHDEVDSWLGSWGNLKEPKPRL
jgi:RHH-type transcriptional regulator, rel operon repressor / antitoxin RelB